MQLFHAAISKLFQPLVILGRQWTIYTRKNHEIEENDFLNHFFY